MRTLILLLALALFHSRADAAVSTNGDQTVTLAAGAALVGSAPGGHAVQWKVKSAPASSACNFPTSGGNDVPVTTVQNPTRAEFSHTGAYVLTFTDTTDSSAADVTITVTANSVGDGTITKTRTVRIMPLGDSITAASGGYRFTLQDKLSAGGYQFDFIGGRHLEKDKDGSHDSDHEGHSGWETINYPFSQEFGWGIDNGGSGQSGYRIDTAGLQPDVVLLMLGTNDVGRGNGNASSRCDRLFQIVDDIWSKVPNARVIVAKIPPLGDFPMTIPGYASKAAWIAEYNNLIGSTVAARQGQGKKISAVDMNSAMTVADLPDGVHPSAGGYAKMAQVWYDGIVAVTSGGGGGGK